MKVATLIAVASVGSLATASNRFPANHRRAARSFGSRSLEARAPSMGTYAANASLEKKDTIHEIAQVAKLVIADYRETAVVAPVDTTVLAAQEKKKADEKAAAKKEAAAAAAAAAATKKAEEEAAAAAAAKKAAVAKAKAERAAKAKAAAAAEKKAEEEKAAAAAAAAAAQKAAEEQAAKKAAAKKAKAEKAAAAKAAAAEKKAAVKVAATKSSSVKLDKVFSGKGNSLIGFVDSNCGPSGATEEEPNGAEHWLNCGLSQSNPNSGWTPPSGVTLDHLTVVSVEKALAGNSVWAPCEQYFSLFEQVEQETGVPAILLASFALQESTCRHDVAGDNGGAFGLMQITQDKCEGRDKAGCQEPYFNVKTAAAYFMTELNNAGGNVIEATARYNGWFPSLSYAVATRYASDPVNCSWQQNLDYLYQMFNGWVLGRTGYQLGSYQNLKVCRH